MNPPDDVIGQADDRLRAAGFEALDVIDGRMGIERHGVQDWTWVASPQPRVVAVASLYRQDVSAGLPQFEVWAGAEHIGGSFERTLVRRSTDSYDVASGFSPTLLDDLVEAGRRALVLAHRFSEEPESKEAKPPVRLVDRLSALEAAHRGVVSRAPLDVVSSSIVDVMLREPERRWKNAELLLTLLEAGVATDRADVNAALSILAASRTIRRVSRGVYTAE